MSRTIQGWVNGEPRDYEAQTLGNAIRAVHDVMKMAAHPGATLRVMATTMQKLVRDDYWQEATPGNVTYGRQLEEILEANGRVSVVVAGSLKEEPEFSPSVRRVLGKYGGRRHSPFQIVYSGQEAADRWKTFPHFHIANRAGNQLYATVEWATTPHDFATMSLESKFQCDVLGNTNEALERCESLVPTFDSILGRLLEETKNDVVAI